MQSVLYNNGSFDVGQSNVDIQSLLEASGLTNLQTESTPDGKITVLNSSPEQLGIFLDALFLKHFGIKPYEDDEDYAVGAEW